MAEPCQSVFHTEAIMIFVKYKCGPSTLLFNSLWRLPIILKIHNTHKFLCIRHCAKSSTHIILFHPHGYPNGKILLCSLFCIWGRVRLREIKSFPKATELDSGWARIRISASLSLPTQEPLGIVQKAFFDQHLPWSSFVGYAYSSAKAPLKAPLQRFLCHPCLHLF